MLELQEFCIFLSQKRQRYYDSKQVVIGNSEQVTITGFKLVSMVIAYDLIMNFKIKPGPNF